MASTQAFSPEEFVRSNPFRSRRLLYRAVESPEDDKFFQALQASNPIDFQNANAHLAKPQSKKDAAAFQKFVAEESLVGAVICLLPDKMAEGKDEGKTSEEKLEEIMKATPIGTIHLHPINARMAQHRFSDIGIDILKEHQGKGYGSEAIEWITGWGFDIAGLHRIELRCFEYNHGARRLYEKLGFKLEGRSREQIWAMGRWWDDFQFGMLDREWREMQAKK